MMNNQPTGTGKERELLAEPQRQMLCQLVRSTRRDGKHPWDMPGITAAVIELEQRASTAIEVIATATTAAANLDYKTPAMMWRPGRHWPPNGDGQRAAPMRATTRRECPEHPGQVAFKCEPCRATVRHATEAEITAMRESAARGRATQREREAVYTGRARDCA